jgi:hypothetical protein
MKTKLLIFSVLSLVMFYASAQDNSISISDDAGNIISVKEGLSAGALPEYLVLKTASDDQTITKTTVTHVSGGQGKSSNDGDSKLMLGKKISKSLKEGDKLVIEVYLDTPNADGQNTVLYINLPIKA